MATANSSSRPRHEILNGWKEVGACLNLTSRTAQRWERLGLPVRRVSNSPRGPIIAFSDEIEHWVRTKWTKVNGVDSLVANIIAYKATKRKTQKLLDELETASKEFERKFDALRNQVLRGRKSPAIRLWQFPDKKD